MFNVGAAGDLRERLVLGPGCEHNTDMIGRRFIPTVYLFAALLYGVGVSAARAAELIMFEQAGCPYCAAFDREVAATYPRTPIGREAPLRRVDIYKPIPPDLSFLKVERATPVFVLIDHGREIGRIRGYPGEANFWGLIENLVGEIAPPPDDTHAERPSGQSHLAGTR
jgi:hypothetical protein